MRLTESQEEKVRTYVEAHGLKVPNLSEDLIDHLCCYLEHEGKAELDFDTQLEEAVRSIAPQGLESLERQTLFLLNATKITIMKRLFFAFGLLASMSFSAGLLFKLLHWPGANIMLFGGALVFLLIFLPFWTLDRFKFKMVKRSYDRWRLILGLAAGILFGLASIFKALHLMGAEILLVSSVFVFVLFFLPLYFFKIYRRSMGLEKEGKEPI